VWENSADVLIKNVDGTPTGVTSLPFHLVLLFSIFFPFSYACIDGWGQYFHDHLCALAGTCSGYFLFHFFLIKYLFILSYRQHTSTHTKTNTEANTKAHTSTHTKTNTKANAQTNPQAHSCAHP
jgi:hypothetical protein